MRPHAGLTATGRRRFPPPYLADADPVWSFYSCVQESSHDHSRGVRPIRGLGLRAFPRVPSPSLVAALLIAEWLERGQPDAYESGEAMSKTGGRGEGDEGSERPPNPVIVRPAPSPVG